MLACRPVGDPVFQVAAHAPRADVTFATGINADVTQSANGSEWYYDPNGSWGFTPVGSTVFKSLCDAQESGVNVLSYPVGPTTEFRICIYTTGSQTDLVWRCGGEIFIGANYERVFLHR